MRRPQRTGSSSIHAGGAPSTPATLLHRSASFHPHNLNSATRAEVSTPNRAACVSIGRRSSPPNVHPRALRAKVRPEVKGSGEREGGKEAGAVPSLISPNASFFQPGHPGRGRLTRYGSTQQAPAPRFHDGRSCFQNGRQSLVATGGRFFGVFFTADGATRFPAGILGRSRPARPHFEEEGGPKRFAFAEQIFEVNWSRDPGRHVTPGVKSADV